MPSIIHCIHRKQKSSRSGPGVHLCPHLAQPPQDRQEASASETRAISTDSFWCTGAATLRVPADSQTAPHLTERRPDWILPAFFLCWLLGGTCEHATWECLDIQSQFPAVALMENNIMSSAKSRETSEFRVHYYCTSSCEHSWWVEVETSEGANVATH